jgi:8-oxo-dGTP pyrophosphatase MutT (NUDIX family)
MIVEVVGAVIRDDVGQVLTVRKRGTERYMLPGGKRALGEDDLPALRRELREELNVELRAARPLGHFEAAAANEAGASVRSSVYWVEITGQPAVGVEIETLLWICPDRRGDTPLAPLLEGKILPAVNAASRARPSGSD